MVAIQSAIEITLVMTGNQPPIIQLMFDVPLENVNVTTDLITLVILVTSLLSHIIFRSYLLIKIGNQTNELFSNKSILTTCLIYIGNMALQPLIGLYFQRPDLVGIVNIPGVTLILPIQILVCHDKALDYFMGRNPKVKLLVYKIKGAFDKNVAPHTIEDEKSTSEEGDTLDQDQVPNPSHHSDEINSVSGRLERVPEKRQETEHDNEITDPHTMWKLGRNVNHQPIVGKGPILINVKSAPNAD